MKLIIYPIVGIVLMFLFFILGLIICSITGGCNMDGNIDELSEIHSSAFSELPLLVSIIILIAIVLVILMLIFFQLGSLTLK